MFHKKLYFLLALTAALTLSGCGSKKEAEPAPADTADDSAYETEAPETEVTLDPITPSSYLVENASDYVTLASLDGLSATQNTYDITDEMLQERIEEELYLYSDEVEAEKASEGNTVYADVTSSVQGVEDSESTESTYFVIGDEDYGPEFDAQLLGKSTGDEFSFSISYDDDAWFEDWAGHTVDFNVKVTGVLETVVPEYDEAFVTENTDYSSKEEYEEALRESMEEEYNAESYSETIDSLFQSVMDQSSFNGYPEELYTFCEDETLSYYGQFLGTDDRAEILDALGATEEDLKSDILTSVNLRLTVSAICEAQDLEVTEEEYISEVTDAAELYGYLNAAEYEEVNTRESIVWALYQEKAADFLYNQAEIIPVKASADDLYGFDDEIDETEFEEETFSAGELYAAESETEE